MFLSARHLQTPPRTTLLTRTLISACVVFAVNSPPSVVSRSYLDSTDHLIIFPFQYTASRLRSVLLLFLFFIFFTNGGGHGVGALITLSPI